MITCDPFSSPEPTIILTSSRDRELWLCPTPEVHDSRTSCQICKSDWLTIWNKFSAHAQKIGSGQSSRSLPQVRMIMGSGDENTRDLECPWRLLYNLQLWRHRRWFQKFNVRFWPIRKAIASSMYNNSYNYLYCSTVIVKITKDDVIHWNKQTFSDLFWGSVKWIHILCKQEEECLFINYPSIIYMNTQFLQALNSCSLYPFTLQCTVVWQ